MQVLIIELKLYFGNIEENYDINTCYIKMSLIV